MLRFNGQPLFSDSALSTPDLYIHTSFVSDEHGRITRTREPLSSSGPQFTLVRSKNSCAWAVRMDIPQDIAEELDGLANLESPVSDFRTAPEQAKRYQALLDGPVHSGLAFEFPSRIARPTGIAHIQDVRRLERHFSGWEEIEIPGRIPIIGIVEDGNAVSVCFCARRSDIAAEAGVETVVEHRGRGLGTKVVAAWASAILDGGRTPLYSTSWSNEASLAVAGKLELVPYACTWSIH